MPPVLVYHCAHEFTFPFLNLSFPPLLDINPLPSDGQGPRVVMISQVQAFLAGHGQVSFDCQVYLHFFFRFSSIMSFPAYYLNIFPSTLSWSVKMCSSGQGQYQSGNIWYRRILLTVDPFSYSWCLSGMVPRQQITCLLTCLLFWIVGGPTWKQGSWRYHPVPLCWPKLNSQQQDSPPWIPTVTLDSQQFSSSFPLIFSSLSHFFCPPIQLSFYFKPFTDLGLDPVTFDVEMHIAKF